VTIMSSAHLSTTFYLANEARRTEFQTRAANERLVAQARARQAGLPSNAAHVASRHDELLAAADAYRLTAQAARPSVGPSFLSTARQAVGMLLVQAGEWITGASPTTASDPLPSA
jgi:hypothetical protein